MYNQGEVKKIFKAPGYSNEAETNSNQRQSWINKQESDCIEHWSAKQRNFILMKVKDLK